MRQETVTTLHQIGTWLANTITITAILGWLPHIASILAIIWYVIIIYEKFSGKKLHSLFKIRNKE